MPSNQELFERFMGIHHLMGALRHKEMKQRGPLGDTTRGQGRVLALLKLRDGVSTRDMATVLGIRVSSLNETLSRMEEAGLVTREPSEGDKRVMLVQLTEQGREFRQEAYDMPELLFGGFSGEEREALEGHLERMASSLNDELGEDAQAIFDEMRHRREEFFERHHGQHGPHGPHRGY